MAEHVLTNYDPTDADLVARSLAGDRDAFNQIVLRYQTLICSLAYNAFGNVGRSEDVAQETFIAAWRHLRELREPSKLRAWLCGIVRNLAHKSFARAGREPACDAEPLEIAANWPADQALPSDEAITQEEEAILWRSLEKIPGVYREPLILFYRERQSIEAVAQALELSPDAVKQRLSRGRRLLQAEVQAFVERTLRRTTPRRGFAGSVLAALPASPPAALGTEVAAKIATLTKSGLFATGFAPFVGIISGLAAHLLILLGAPDARQRRLKAIAFSVLWMVVLVWCVLGQFGMRALSAEFRWSSATFVRVMAVYWWSYAIALATVCIPMFRRISTAGWSADLHPSRLPAADAKRPKIGLCYARHRPRAYGVPPLGGPLATKHKTLAPRFVIVVGIHLSCFWWLIELAYRARDFGMAELLAGITVVLAIVNFVQLGSQTGPAARCALGWHLAVIWGVILICLNLRLESWAAVLHGIDLAEMHRQLPAWIIPALTLTFLAWVGLLLRRPRRGSSQ